MPFEQLLALSKIISLLIFVPLFLGVCVYALNGKNKARFEELARIPLQED